MQLCSSLNILWHFLFFGIRMKTDLFQFCGHCWVFHICWYIECSTFTASSFRIWNSSTGILLPPLALFIVMFPKAHLTSHSRMSGSRWVITPSCSSGSISAWNVPLVFLICLKRCLSYSIVFLCFSALITEEGFLISPWYSLDLCIQMGISFLFSFAFSFSSFLSYL